MRNRNQLNHLSNTNSRDSTSDEVGTMNLRDYLHVQGNVQFIAFAFVICISDLFLTEP